MRKEMFAPRDSRAGFTVMELLIVIGVMMILFSILLPVLDRARKQASIIAQRGDFAALSQAIYAYKNDYGDFPRAYTSGYAGTGYSGLAAMLGDKNVWGTGQRVIRDATSTARGKSFGPYVATDRFKVVSYRGTHFVDRWGTPIMYYPRYGLLERRISGVPGIGGSNAGKLEILRDAWRSVSGQSGATYPVFDAQDGILCRDNCGFMQPPAPSDCYMSTATQGPAGTYNSAGIGILPTPNCVDGALLTGQVFRVMVGDEDANGFIEPAKGERLRVEEPFVLVSGGPDGADLPAYTVGGSSQSAVGFNLGFENWAKQRRIFDNGRWGTLLMLDDDVRDPAFVHGQYCIPEQARRKIQEMDDVYSFTRN